MPGSTQVLQKILSDPKIAANGNLASKVYRDQPILMPASRMERFTPPRIREMRRLARGDDVDVAAFYRQAEFMEAFEDDFDYRGEFNQYFPTYQHMSDAQLRGYFSWRTRVRNGAIGRTCLSFAFVYIYELLNQIGVSSPLEGFHALRNFWTAYRGIDPRITMYVELWLKDYVIYNNLDKALLEGLPDVAFDQALTVLLDHKAYGAGEVFSALNSVSSYDLENSRFFKLHPDDVREVVRRVFSAVSDHHNRNPQKSARDKLFGRVCASSYAMFKAAVFHPRAVPGRLVYEIGAFHKYMCLNGRWSCERFLWYGNNNKRIGALLKTVDFLMRREYGFASTLQAGKTNKPITARIDKEIAKYREEKREAASRRIDIDTSKLQGIRTTALATQNKLLVEDAAAVETMEKAAPPTDMAEKIGQEPVTALSDVELRFVNCLLHGLPYDSLVRAGGVMLSVLIDGINAKLFDVFGDTIIIDAGDGPGLVDEYIEELKGIVGQ